MGTLMDVGVDIGLGMAAASGSVPGPCDTTKKLWSPSTESSHESKSETMYGVWVKEERERERGGDGKGGVGHGWLSGAALSKAAYKAEAKYGQELNE